MFPVGPPERIPVDDSLSSNSFPSWPIVMGHCQIGTRPPVGGDRADEWKDANRASGPIDRALAGILVSVLTQVGEGRGETHFSALRGTRSNQSLAAMDPHNP